jgi:hypothetical protein
LITAFKTITTANKQTNKQTKTISSLFLHLKMMNDFVIIPGTTTGSAAATAAPQGHQPTSINHQGTKTITITVPWNAKTAFLSLATVAALCIGQTQLVNYLADRRVQNMRHQVQKECQEALSSKHGDDVVNGDFAFSKVAAAMDGSFDAAKAEYGKHDETQSHGKEQDFAQVVDNVSNGIQQALSSSLDKLRNIVLPVPPLVAFLLAAIGLVLRFLWMVVGELSQSLFCLVSADACRPIAGGFPMALLLITLLTVTCFLFHRDYTAAKRQAKKKKKVPARSTKQRVASKPARRTASAAATAVEQPGRAQVTIRNVIDIDDGSDDGATGGDDGYRTEDDEVEDTAQWEQPTPPPPARSTPSSRHRRAKAAAAPAATPRGTSTYDGKPAGVSKKEWRQRIRAKVQKQYKNGELFKNPGK